MKEPFIKIKILGGNKYGKIRGLFPNKMRAGDACFDICSAESSSLGPYRRKLFETNLQFKVPEGYMGKIYPRVSMWERDIDVLPGIINPNSRGSLKIGLVNNSGKTKYIKSGERICQIAFTEAKIELLRI